MYSKRRDLSRIASGAEKPDIPEYLPKRNWPPIIMPLNCIKTLWLKQAGLYFLMKEAIAARVNDGVLTVTLPKMAKPECPAARQIEVK